MRSGAGRGGLAGGSGGGCGGLRRRGCGGRARTGAAESRANVAELDVGEGDRRAGRGALDGGGEARAGAAGAARNAGLGRISVGRVVAVEPEHARRVVVPDREREHHAVAERLAHLREAAVLRERVGVAEHRLLLRAEVLRDRVDWVDSGDVDVRVLDHLAALDVQTADLREGAGRRVVAGHELGHDGEWLGGVDSHALAEEGLVAHAERVEVAAVGVAQPGVASALVARAALLAGRAARVRGERSRVVVGLPDVHLAAARAEAAVAGVGTRAGPALDVGL